MLKSGLLNFIKSNRYLVISTLVSIATAVTFVFTLPPKKPKLSFQLEAPQPRASLFSQNYPQNERFQNELKLMRQQKKLTAKNEILLQKSLALTSQRFNIPLALSWCLFFQESRLNHLEGIGKENSAHGLGQFGYFSFYEINRQTNQYYSANFDIMTSLLGSDVRPISPRKSDIYHPSSYYSIPTAVVASSMYLNNRYWHLRNILDESELAYDPEVLWLWAAVAYNKGTRSVLNIWNEIRRTHDEQKLIQVLTHREGIEGIAHSPRLVLKALNYVWPRKSARLHTEEVLIHIQNINACALTPSPSNPSEGTL